MKPRISSRPFVAVIFVLGLMVVVAACGGGSSRQQSSSSQSSASSSPPPAATSAPPSTTATTPPAASAPESSASAASGGIEVIATDEGGQFRFSPATIEARPGQQLAIRVVNKGASAHDFSLVDLKVETGLIDPGREKTITFTAPSRPGEYQFVCTVPGHLQLGMQGKLVVR